MKTPETKANRTPMTLSCKQTKVMRLTLEFIYTYRLFTYVFPDKWSNDE